MALDHVAPDEMQIFARPDPIDAALGGGSDDPAVDALVRDLRAAYLPDAPVARSAALTAFAGEAGTAPVATPAPVRAPLVALAPVRNRRAAVAAAAFAASLGGKLVLGGAVAAAAVGGLHATEVVDVPFLPDVARGHVPEDLPDVADPLPVEQLLVPGPPRPVIGQDGGVVEPIDGSSPARPAGVSAPEALPADGSTRPDVAEGDDRDQHDPAPVAPAPRPAPDSEAPGGTPPPSPHAPGGDPGQDDPAPTQPQPGHEQADPAQPGENGSPDDLDGPSSGADRAPAAGPDQGSRTTP